MAVASSGDSRKSKETRLASPIRQILAVQPRPLRVHNGLGLHNQTTLIVCVPGSSCLAPLASVTQELETYRVRRRLSGPSSGVTGAYPLTRLATDVLISARRGGVLSGT